MNTEWNLKQLYDSIEDPQIEKDIQKDKDKVEKFVKKWRENKDYTEKPNVLKKALDDYNTLSEDLGKPIYYSILLQSVDSTDEEIKKLYNNCINIYTLLGNSLSFFNLNISKIDKSKQDIFLNSKELEVYKHLLENSFVGAKYLLTEKEENIFNLTAKTSSTNWANMLSELLNKQTLTVLDEDLKEIVISYNEASKYLQSSNKKVRDYAAEEFRKINAKYEEIAEFEINSILERKKISDDYRGIRRADEPRHLSDDIETEVIDTLIDSVSSDFSISQRFYKLKAKILNQKTLSYAEKSVPVGKQSKEYSFEESLEIVKRVFKSLDPEFHSFVEATEGNGYYDVYPREGKTGGAFCVSDTKQLPILILLNHKDTIESVTTLAHESGHGIHAFLSQKEQCELNSGHPFSLAEVASTFFEDFVLEDILEREEEEDFKRVVRMKKLDDDIATIFRQIAAYKFEQELHERFREEGFLSKKTISEIFTKHMHAYLGDSVDIDDSMKLGWIYWSHFRRPFYVYSYASGLLISKGLQSLVREDPNNIESVKEFLSSGSSLSPKDVFGKMGIDITKREFWERGLKEIDKELTLLEKEYGR